MKKLLMLSLSLLLVISLAACGGTANSGGDNGDNGDGDPGAPANSTMFEANAVSASSVQLAWATVQGAESYTIERKSGTGAYSQIATPSAADTSYSDTGLSPATKYTYRLKSVNGEGASAGVEASATTKSAGNGGTYTKLGLVSLNETMVPGFSSRIATGSFSELAQAIDLPDNQYGQIEDTCSVILLDDSTPPPTPTPVPDSDPTSLDAGDLLTVKADGTTYATLNKQITGKNIFYQSPATSPLAPLPTSATIDIPGTADGFPAFENAAFPDIPADFTLSATPSLDQITTDSSFSWTGTGTNDSIMLLSGSGQNAEDKTVYFTCFAKDDGNFVLPAKTQAELNTNGFTTGALSFAQRVASSSQTQGNAALLLSVSRGKSYGQP